MGRAPIACTIICPLHYSDYLSVLLQGGSQSQCQKWKLIIVGLVRQVRDPAAALGSDYSMNIHYFSFLTPILGSPLLGSTSGCLGWLSSEVTQSFICEHCETLVTKPLLGSGSCKIPFIIFPGHGGTRRRPSEFPEYHTHSLLPLLCSSSLIFSWHYPCGFLMLVQ